MNGLGRCETLELEACPVAPLQALRPACYTARVVKLAPGTSLRSVADVLRNAAVFGRDQWTDNGSPNMTPAPDADLPQQIQELFALLRDRHIDYLLVGGIALLRYIDGRNTEAIDLLLSVESLEAIPEIVLTDRNPSFARGCFKNLRVDLLFTANPLFKLVHDQFATVHRFHEIDVRCATVEGLILLKLYALPSLYRQGDAQRIALYETDILMLAQRHHPDMNALLATLRTFVEAGQLQALTEVVHDIQQRIARIDNASRPGA